MATEQAVIEPAPSYHDLDTPALSRTTSRAVSTFEEFKANRKREKFVLKRKTQPKPVVPTESVLNFSRDEYPLQRPLYIASYMAGWMMGSPESGIYVVKGAEKGIQKLTGITPDPIGRRRAAKKEKNRLAAKAELDALGEAAEEDEADRRSVHTQATTATAATAATAATGLTDATEVRPLMRA